jgi:hypothetical protein
MTRLLVLGGKKSNALLLFAIAVLSSGVASRTFGFDGFNVNSSTFTNQYNGNQIWDGTAFQNMWSQAGGATTAALSLNGTALVINNEASGLPDGNNGWIQQDTGTSPWELGTGNWTIEISAKVNDTTAANDNFVLWTTLGGSRFLLRIAKDAVGYSEAGVNLVSGINNADTYHTFRVAYEANNPTGGPNGTFHVWRDNVPISDAGATRVAADTTDRLIIGDCCTSIGNPIDPFEIQYVRYSMAGAFSPIADQQINLQINRNTGAITLNNTTGAPLPNIIGYSLLSDAGGLTQTGWDKQSTGTNLTNDNDQWTTVSGASSVNDLSEVVLNTTGDDNGGDLAATNGSWSFGTVWRKSPFEDIRMELLLDDGTILTNIADPTADFSISYIGNDGVPFASGDFDFDSDIDSADWALFKSKYRSANLTAIGAPASHQAQLYNLGDLNLDGQYTLADFVAFEAAYDAVNGIGAFAAIAIPEPTTATFLVICGTTLMMIRRGKAKQHFGRLSVLALIAVGTLFGDTPTAVAQNTITNPGTTNTGDRSNTSGFAFRADAGTFPASISPAGSLTDIFALTKMTLKRPDDTTTPSFGTGVRQTTDANAPIFLDVYTNLNGGTDTFSGYVGSSSTSVAWSGTTQNATYSFDFSNMVLSKSTKYWFVFSEDAVDGEVSNFRHRVATGGSNTGTGDNASGYLLNDTAQVHTQGGGESDWGTEYVAEFTPVLSLKLRVNTISGAVSLENPGAFNFDINSYSITSTNSLSTAGWNSLEDHFIGDDPTPGNKNNGDSWEEFDNVSSSFLGEGFLTGDTSIVNGSPLSLGSIFKVGGAQDLTFTYTATNLGGLLTGDVEYFAASQPGDFDSDGDVDGRDFLIWQRGGSPNPLSPGDLALWRSNYGVGPLIGSVTAVPEPSGVMLALVAAGLTMVRRWRIAGVGMAAVCCGMVATTDHASAAVFNDRHYTLGDLSNIGYDSQGVNLTAFPGAIDTGAFQDLLNNGGVTTTNVGPGGLKRPGLTSSANGAVFDGVDDSLTTAVSLNSPNHTWNTAAFFPTALIPPDTSDDGQYDPPSAVGADGPDPDTSYTPAFPHNYLTIFGRGIQLWARPTDLDAVNPHRQDLVMDSNQQGIFITDTHNWGLQFDGPNGSGNPTARDGGSINSGVSVASTLDANGWAHVMQIVGMNDPVGGHSAFGGALLVNGVAVVASNTFYDPDTSAFAIGSNRAHDNNFYTGALDEVRLFIWGDNSEQAPTTNTTRGYLGGTNWGTLNLSEDNDWIKQKLTSLGVTSPGDVDLNGTIDAADVTAFISHWRKTFVVNDLQIGDWVSRQQGDLDYNGTVDLADAFILHEALNTVGLSLDFGLLSATVPEPSTSMLLVVGGTVFTALSRRRTR